MNVFKHLSVRHTLSIIDPENIEFGKHGVKLFLAATSNGLKKIYFDKYLKRSS